MDLLPLEESLSPRLKWMRDHEIKTAHIEGKGVFKEPQWAAWTIDPEPTEPFEGRDVGWGKTEASALIDFARKNDLTLWK